MYRKFVFMVLLSSIFAHPACVLLILLLTVGTIRRIVVQLDDLERMD